MVLDASSDARTQSSNVTEQEKISPAYIAKEFAHQYYRVLNMAPSHIHRFYSYSSTLVLEEDEEPSVGQAEIQKRFSKSVLPHCSTRIYAIHGLYTLSNGVVAQVIGEMSLPGKPMRYFTQTFVLEQQTAHKYYISNDIFCFLDSAKANSLWPLPVESYENGRCVLDDARENVSNANKSLLDAQADVEERQRSDGTLGAINSGANSKVSRNEENGKALSSSPSRENEVSTAMEQKGPNVPPVSSQPSEGAIPEEIHWEEQTTWATIVKTPSEKQEIDSRIEAGSENRAVRKNLHLSVTEQAGRNESLTSEAVEVPQNQIFVGNLPEDIKELEVRNCFKVYGKVTSVIIRCKRTLHMGRDAGLAVYAFVAFADKESVTRVLNDSQNVLVRGHIRVNIQLRRSPQPARLRYGEARNGYRDGRNTGTDYNNWRPPYKGGVDRYGQANSSYARNGPPCNVGVLNDMARRGRVYPSQRGRSAQYPT
uniref:NTF2 domain-containing protein n=1 Tax=Trichuris muris TaxID=70415 RepID=A0A5S6R348_TRIMR